MADNDELFVIDGLGMCVDEVERIPSARQSSGVGCACELEMICVADGDYDEESTANVNCLLCDTVDYNHTDKHSTGCVPETGPCYEIDMTEAVDSELEHCRIGLDVSQPQSQATRQNRTVKDSIKSYKNQNNDGTEVEVWSADLCAYVCEFCHKQFRDTSELKRHIATHVTVKLHSCCYCSKTFLYPSHLVLHMKKHTGVVDTNVRWSCDICKREFRSSTGLRKHRRIHDEIQRHRCSVCSKAFAFASLLSEHVQTHSMDCPLLCDICGHGFKYMSNLLKHRRVIHEPANSSSCQLCGPHGQCICPTEEKSSSQSLANSQLQCPICLKWFKNKSYKEMHLRVHTGDRPYKCLVQLACESQD